MESLNLFFENFCDLSYDERKKGLDNIIGDEVYLASFSDQLCESLMKILPFLNEFPQITCQIVAELSKQESARCKLTKNELLFRCLDTWLKQTGSQYQACRALGNLCYDNESARLAFLPFLCAEGGLKTTVAEACTVAGQTTEDNSSLRGVCSGVVLNLTNSHQHTLTRCVQLGIVEQLVSAAVRSPANREVSFLRNVVTVCTFVCDYQDHLPVLLSTPTVALVESALAASCAQDGVADETLLEAALVFVKEWCECETEASLLLAASSVCITLCELADRGSTPFHLVKMIGDILIILVNCDRAMTVLYQKGNSSVFSHVTRWISAPVPQLATGSAVAERDIHLATVGLFCLVNFAASDDHSLAMVRAGVHHTVLQHICVQLHCPPPPPATPATATPPPAAGDSSADKQQQQQQWPTCDFQRLSGALSALRNLSVPTRNLHQLRRPAVSRLLQLWHCQQLQHNPQLLFKYFAILRLLTDTTGETAAQLLLLDDNEQLQQQQQQQLACSDSLTALTLQPATEHPVDPVNAGAQQDKPTESVAASGGGSSASVLATICRHALSDSVTGVQYEARRLLARLARSLMIAPAKCNNNNNGAGDGDVTTERPTEETDRVAEAAGGETEGAGGGDPGAGGAQHDYCHNARRLLSMLAGDELVLRALVLLASSGGGDGSGSGGALVMVNEALVALSLLAPHIGQWRHVLDCGLAQLLAAPPWWGSAPTDQPKQQQQQQQGAAGLADNWCSLKRVLRSRFAKVEHECFS